MYNFNKIIDRKNTDSLKYDCAKKYGFPPDVIPLWVADMDFQTPPQVVKALKKCARHAIFGYSEPDDAYYATVQNWFLKRFAFKSQREWIVKTAGIVFSLAASIKAFTKPGDAVLIQTPVYHPFHSLITMNKRKLVKNSLINSNGAYSIDFDDFEKKIVENKVKLFLLCSPHNPVGRVWTKQELKKMADICLKRGVLVMSDEIHCDFIYKGFKHTVFANLGEKHLKNCAIFTAPSKTFNLAGLQASNVFIADEILRNKFKTELEKTGYEQLNVMGLTACRAAYKYGHSWVRELNAYLEKNLDYIKKYLKANIPQIKLTDPQGTYLIWLDFNALGLGQNGLRRLTVDKAGLWLSNGKIFGAEGRGFFRMNIACPLRTIKTALERLKTAIDAK
ncbi:MAG: pyridoxal phosphate-dependent aminotransferase [Endomicrobium sp.]|jgi:cystathionine beta-lyase|nr:pyridoxal phosphate-dependent aminotransferase [Endomicrobium sp.]